MRIYRTLPSTVSLLSPSKFPSTISLLGGPLPAQCSLFHFLYSLTHPGLTPTVDQPGGVPSWWYPDVDLAL